MVNATGPAPLRRRRVPLLLALLAVLIVTVVGVISYQWEAGFDVGGPVGPQPDGIAVAVLPFDNQSGSGREFLADGFADGLVGALSGIAGLHIVGRESAQADRRTTGDALAKTLRATYRVGGSLRKDGAQLRVAVQLTRVGGGAVWRETYDRAASDVFAVLEEIAGGVASALHLPVTLKPDDRLVRDRTADMPAYDEYLRAKATIRMRSFSEAAALLEQVVAKEAGYAPAYVALASAYQQAPAAGRAYLTGDADGFRYAVSASLPKAEDAARRATARNPDLADGHAVLGLVLRDKGQWQEAETAFKRALALDADNPAALHGYSDMLAAAGYLREALAVRQRLMMLDPLVPAFNASNAIQLWLDAQDNAATAMLRALPAGTGAPLLAEQWAAANRYNSAADTLASIPPDSIPAEMVQEAVRLLRTAPSMTASPLRLARLNGLSWVYLHIGAVGRALEFHEMLLAAGDAGASAMVLWHPAYAPVRKTDRFKAYVQKAGLVTYWRARGWTEFCRPGSGDDFTCD